MSLAAACDVSSSGLLHHNSGEYVTRSMDQRTWAYHPLDPTFTPGFGYQGRDWLAIG
jgi:hypothetical protein